MMSTYGGETEHRRKRRRREILPQPVCARLVFDDSLKGHAACLSSKLATALAIDESTNPESVIALAPISPFQHTIRQCSWTICDVDLSATSETNENLLHVRLSPSSPASQAFLRVFASQDHGRHGSHLPKFFEVSVVPTVPVSLDTIFVTIEKGLLEKVDEIQSKFGGGFQNVRTKRASQSEHVFSPSTNTSSTAEDRITELVRGGLSKLSIIRIGDIFHLPLPAHPITHVRPAPAIVAECEPVSQGFVSEKTKIVVLYAGHSQEKALKKLATPTAIIEESLEDTAEDTANDQFFSAAEDRGMTTTASDVDGSEDEDPTTETSDTGDSDEESDSMDDMISLSAPGLPPQQAGTLSAMTAATPRPGQFGRATGINTPGSVYSSFTATTARAGVRPGKVFRTEALLDKVPLDMLHPKPSPHEDDDSFVFVDTTTLAKLGCFSGDWARIEVARNISSFGLGQASFTSTNANNEEDSDFRTVRVFGLSGLLQQKARYIVDKTGDRRSSFSQGNSFQPLSPALYLSPILLANLSNAQYVKLGAMPKAAKTIPKPLHAPRPPSYRGPPLAREVSLAKVLTPLTQDAATQSAIFTSLKSHFAERRRLVKIGDIVAVPIDEDLARTTSSPGNAEMGQDDEQLLSKLNIASASNRTRLDVAWFVVQSVDADLPSDNSSTVGDAENWGGTTILDTSQTKLGVSGTSFHKVSDSIEVWSKYWLGLRSVPVSQPEYLTTKSALPDTARLPIEKRLVELIAAATSPRAITLGLPPLVILLHSTQRQVGKSYAAKHACASVGVHTFSINIHELLSENASTSGGGDVKTEGLLRVRTERALSCGVERTALLLQNVDVLTADRMVSTVRDVLRSARVLIATTSKIDDVPAGLRSLFTHELEVTAPDEAARELILSNLCGQTTVPLSSSVNLKNVALQTAALVAGDLVDVVQRANLARSNRLDSLAEVKNCNVVDLMISGGPATRTLTSEDFSAAISAARSTFSDAIGAPKIPSVTWRDVGGLASQKDSIMETISLPLTHPELFANGVRKRSGILFYGPPGTGKTLLAKAIATEFSLNFFSVKGPELLNMYIGESEANVRRVFQKARDARPCVVFFDELDSVAPKRGNQGDSGGVMDRIVSQLLAELDGMSGGGQDEDGQPANAGGVFVVGATNRPDLLDPALLRPGRFDKMLYLGVADSHESQATILEALTRKFVLAREVNLKRVAQKLPFTYTGADLYALCSDAMLKAITRKTKAVDERVAEISSQKGKPVSTGWFFDHAATSEDIEVVVNEEDFDLAQKELVGSVSAKELEHFERIRHMFEDQDISAGTKAASNQTNGQSHAPPQPQPRRISRTDTAIHSNEPAISHVVRPHPGKQRINKGKGVAVVDPEASADSDYGFSMHGTTHMNGFANGTDKGKLRVTTNDFTDDAGNDEDLYD